MSAATVTVTIGYQDSCVRFFNEARRHASGPQRYDQPPHSLAKMAVRGWCATPFWHRMWRHAFFGLPLASACLWCSGLRLSGSAEVIPSSTWPAQQKSVVFRIQGGCCDSTLLCPAGRGSRCSWAQSSGATRVISQSPISYEALLEINRRMAAANGSSQPVTGRS